MLGSGQRYQILSHCARVKNPLPCENHKCFRRAVVCFQTRAILAWSCVFWLAQCAKRVIPIMYLMPLPTACQGFIAAAISCLHQHFPFFPPQFHSPQLVFIDSGLPTRSSSHCHLLKLPKLLMLSSSCSRLACLLEMQHSYTVHYWQLVATSSPEILVMDQWKCFQGWYWSLCSMVGVFYFRALSLVVSHMILVSGFFLLTQIVLNTTHASVCQDGMDSDTLLPETWTSASLGDWNEK